MDCDPDQVPADDSSRLRAPQSTQPGAPVSAVAVGADGFQTYFAALFAVQLKVLAVLGRKDMYCPWRDSTSSLQRDRKAAQSRYNQVNTSACCWTGSWRRW